MHLVIFMNFVKTFKNFPNNVGDDGLRDFLEILINKFSEHATVHELNDHE